MKLSKIKKPNMKAWATKMRSLTKEDVKLYWKKRKERRVAILAKRSEGRMAKFFAPISRVVNRYSMVFHVLLAVLLNFIIEGISRHSGAEAWVYMTKSPWVFCYNTFLIFISFSLVYLVRRRTFARIIISVMWLSLGICNGYMLMKRVTPFNAQDMKVLGDAVSLINAYFTGIEIVFVSIGIVSVIIWLISMWRRGNQFNGKMHRKLALVGCVAWVVVFLFTTNIALDKRVVSNYFGNIAFAYEDYGLPYCFMSSVFNTGISEPHGYSEDTMMEITNNGEASTKAVNHNEQQPNVLIVQLESFFDPKEVEFFETSTDPIPNFRAIAEDYSAGYFKVPSVGAGTANTEFEVLTGMNMRYFGPGEYPYKTILRKSMAESAATAFDNIGYGVHALHNNGGNFYSRAEVYDHLGFDSYTSKEMMNILRVTPQGWAKDDVLTKYINKAMDSTEESDFVFTVSVEGHGSYPEDAEVVNPAVTLSGIEDEGKQNSWEYYVSLVHSMDEFVGDLVVSMEERGEPTVIVFYGDHLPTLGLQVEDLKSRYLYNTNYVIWDNIGLEEKDQNLAAYQLMSELMSQIGIESGTVFNYQQDRRKTQNYLADLEMLQYDLLYGKQYAYQDHKVLAEKGHMTMGVEEVLVTDMTIQYDNDYCLQGENFTKWSKIYVNGERQKSSFLNDNRIDLEDIELKDGDLLTVSQVGSSSTIFRNSGVYEYQKGELILVEAADSDQPWRDIEQLED